MRQLHGRVAFLTLILSSSLALGQAPPDTKTPTPTPPATPTATPTQNEAPEATPPPPPVEERVTTVEEKVGGLEEAVRDSRGILDKLEKIKLSGYIQGRFEMHEDSAPGLNSTNKPAETTQFLVRRGRFKVVYAGTLAEFLLQIDAASSGVSLKDAEATFIEPWSGQNIRLTIGQFKWPFGYEVLQSSSVREMPERSLVIRKLFPGERDRGVRVQWNHGVLRSSVALVNGNGTQDATFPANDSNGWKDVVGRVGADFDVVAFGVSGYWGKSLVATPGNAMAMPPTSPTYVEYDKGRVGFDVETYLDVPHLGGLALKAELIYAKDTGVTPFGWWVLAVQNFCDQFGVFVRLDQFDPNVDKDSDATTTIGGGLHFFPSGNIKLTGTYEHPITQGTDPGDDILTLQLQAMF